MTALPSALGGEPGSSLRTSGRSTTGVQHPGGVHYPYETLHEPHPPRADIGAGALRPRMAFVALWSDCPSCPSLIATPDRCEPSRLPGQHSGARSTNSSIKSQGLDHRSRP
jgi:hypothetical protein